MVLPAVTRLVIADLNGRQADEIRESVSTMKLSFSSSGVSQLEFSVTDPKFKMWNSHYFLIRRQVYYLTPGNPIGTPYEVAAVEIEGDPKQGDSVNVTCRAAECQRMKRDKGAANFGAISPTSLASQMAAKFGLGFFGESSPAKDAIVRTQNETTDESTWDVLRRLASDLQFEFFEADGILYFASQKFIMDTQVAVSIGWPPKPTDTMPMFKMSLRRSDNNPRGLEFSGDFHRTNGIKLRPGMRLQITRGLDIVQERMMITNVDWDEGGVEPVKVRANSLDDLGGGVSG